MIAWLQQNFPLGKNYLVAQTHREQLNSILMPYLLTQFQSGRKQNLWGEKAMELPTIGRELGWIPNKMPGTFLNETVGLELADAIATTKNNVLPGFHEIQTAHVLLHRIHLSDLAERHPLQLSEGETKILWFLNFH